jgi:hypothetical protein
MTDFLSRLNVLFGAVLTWMVAVAAGLSAAAAELAELAPEGSEGVTATLVRVAAWLAVAVAAVRRHTPVPPESRGLLPVLVSEPEGDPDFWPPQAT